MSAGLKAAGQLVANSRFEVIPTDSIEESVLAAVPREVTLTVTASPTKGLDATISLAEKLRQHGYEVVPHISARLVVDDTHLDEIVARLRGCGIDDIFVPAGDADPPAGRFDSALSLLVQLDALGRPFDRIGITGYPQSHPNIDDDVTVQAMWDKRHYATYIVSNLCFDPSVIKNWIKRVRTRGVTLPLYFGLAGPVERTKLLNMATKIGVGESARFLSGHAEWFVRMGAPGGYNPSRLLAKTGVALADPASIVEGLHVFTFNQVRQSEEWRRTVLGSHV
ncbi:MAG: methylenetetrahydrofolate reductase [Acidimicrobiales bacterium]